MNDGIEVLIMLDSQIDLLGEISIQIRENKAIKLHEAYISPSSSEMYIRIISMAPEPCVLTDTCTLVEVL